MRIARLVCSLVTLVLAHADRTLAFGETSLAWSNIATDLGRNRPESGEGPPFEVGRVRSGRLASVAGDTGTTNCDLWTSTTLADTGTAAKKTPAVASRVRVGAWSVGLGSCFAGIPARCVED